MVGITIDPSNISHVPRERTRERVVGSRSVRGPDVCPSILVERIRAHCTAARSYLGRSISGKESAAMIAIDACVLPVASARGCEPKHVLFHPTVSTYTQYTYIHTYIHTYTIHRTGRGKTGYYDSNRVERIKLVENNLSKVYPFIFDRKINIKIFRSDFSEFSVPS